MRTALLAAAAALALAAPASAAVTFISATANSSTEHLSIKGVNNPEVDVIGFNEGTDEAFSMRTIYASSSLSVPLTVGGVLVADTAGAYSASTTFTDSANWQFAALGTQTASAYTEDGMSQATMKYNLTYAFTIDTASNLNFDYVNGGMIYLSGDKGFSFVSILTGNGSRNVSLAPGAYSIMVDMGAADLMTIQTGLGSTTENLSASYNFSITQAAVPEPATWALMIGGFGMAGATLRRRRHMMA